MFSSSAVIICIGSERIAGDSLAPAVGDILTNDYGIRAFVYGNTSRSISGRDYEEWLAFIKRAHPQSPLLAVDAALGREEGKITVRRGGVRPKAATGAKADAVGDVGILAAVAPVSDSPLNALMSVSAVKVFDLARKVAFVIFCALSNVQLNSSYTS